MLIIHHHKYPTPPRNKTLQESTNYYLVYVYNNYHANKKCHLTSQSDEPRDGRGVAAVAQVEVDEAAGQQQLEVDAPQRVFRHQGGKQRLHQVPSCRKHKHTYRHTDSVCSDTRVASSASTRSPAVGNTNIHTDRQTHTACVPIPGWLAAPQPGPQL